MMDGTSQLSLPPAVWILVFLAAFLLEWTRLRLLSVVLLGSGYLLAFIAGLIDWRAGIVLVLLLAVAYAVAPRRPQALRVAGHVVFVALNNLLLVCLTEEALFRGYLQEGLSRRFAERAHGEALAVGIAAALFGIAHAAGGAAYVIVAGLAGVGYGLAYRAGGLQASILAHFGLNLSHFTLFTYPMLAS